MLPRSEQFQQALDILNQAAQDCSTGKFRSENGCPDAEIEIMRELVLAACIRAQVVLSNVDG